MLYPAFMIFDLHFFNTGENKNLKQNGFRTFVVLGTIALGIASIGNFDNMLALFGSVLCTPLGLILPPIFHYQTFKSSQSGSRSIFDLLFFLIGCSISVVVFTFTIAGFFS